ncbi:MAG: TonB-dependent receptor plug domain-containing protein [Oligoflexia bacterium]|nr:TonB-dependent receptor plug domain-containing protein [Oligoflexia bacterium]
MKEQHVIRFLSSLFILILSFNVNADTPIKGRLMELGTRTPFTDITFFILPEKTRVTTNEKGEFETTLPDGKHSAHVNIPGYIKTRIDFDVPHNGSVELLVEKSTYNPYETTVQTKANTVQVSQKNISAADASKIAGTGGDTLRAVQTLPGVARSSATSANVIIRGSDPNDTHYLIDGHEVPIIFHFGGLASVVNTDLLDEVIYLPGGFGSPYGRVTSGIIGTTLRDPKTDRMHGYIFADVINAGLLIETPLGSNWSLGITGRRSYIGDVLKAVAKNNKSFEFSVAPYYYDGLITATNKISETKKLKFSLLGSYDELSFLIKEPRDTEPAIRGNLNNITKFYRVIGTYTDKISETDTFKFSTAYGVDNVHFDIGDYYFDLATKNISIRTDWEHRHNTRNATRIGVDNVYWEGTVKYKIPLTFGNPITVANLVENETHPKEAQTAVFTEHRVGLLEDSEKWTLTPGVRVDRFKITQETLASPRLSSRYALSDSFALRASSGLYYQPPNPQFTDSVYGNPGIRSPHAIHYVLGAEANPNLAWFNSFTLETDLFYKDLRDLIITNSRMRYSNDGIGRIVGAELMMRFAKNQWAGWLSYTLSRSTRTEPDASEHTFKYDQTHNVTLVANYKTTTSWEYGLRGRYVTGNPKTPIVGARFDADNDTYAPEYGSAYSERLPAFFQIDFRIDKRWVYNTWILNTYLDIQNLTNSKNVESISYSYNFSQKEYITGLPLIPSFGLRAEF